MAGRTVNRKALREQADAAEARGATEAVEKPVKAKKEPAKRSRAKAPVEVRVKVYWVVFSPNLKRVAVFEFNQEVQARKKASELSESTGNAHFVQKIKEPVT
jgi:hypothetical protein